VLAVVGGLVALGRTAPWASTPGAASPLATSSLACSVKASCGVGEVAVLRLSGLSNAHAGTPGGSAYGNVVCCALAGLSTSCSGVYDTVLTLSGTDNAHVASDPSYATKACLSVGPIGTVDCAYGTSCGVGYACLATISGTTNAHIADCDGVDDYATKVCCLADDPDVDDDCMTLTYEQANACLNPSVPDATGNPDADTLKTFAEMTVASNPCLANPEHAPDTDADQFSDGLEQYVGTDPLDNCPDNLSDPAWPLDMNNDKKVSSADILAAYPGKVSPPTNWCGGAGYDRRADLDADAKISAADVLQYAAKVSPPTTCT